MEEDQGITSDQGQIAPVEAQEGQPQVVEPQLPEKYQGKSIQDFVKMHEEAERRMHEATEQAAKIKREHEQLYSQYQIDLQRFNSRQQVAPSNQPDPTIEKFRKYVNPQDEVIDTVREFAVNHSRQAIMPEISNLSKEYQSVQAQLYQLAANNFYASDSEAKNLQSDIQNVGSQVGQLLYSNLLAAGLDKNQIDRVWNRVTYDTRMLPVLKAMARGMKSHDYFAQFKQPTTVNNDDKKHLGSGGGSSTAQGGVVTKEQFDAMSDSQQREYLKKTGALS